jgi:hypothetical protein
VEPSVYRLSFGLDCYVPQVLSFSLS